MRNQTISSVCVLSGLMLLSIVAQSAPVVDRVTLLAASCATCHGTEGHSAGGTPSLAGLDRLYFIQQMQQFKSGKRTSTVMMYHASGYREQEIEMLADYFASRH